MGTMTQGDESRSLPDADDVSFRSPWLKGLLLAFCCWHAAVLIISIIPPPPAREDPGNPAMDLYRLALSGRQQWNMFETIPVLHSMGARLEGKDGRGDIITAGCVLPGFKPYPMPEDSRYYVLIYRMMFFDNKVPYRNAYLKKAAKLMSARQGTGERRTWSLVLDGAYTRNLIHIVRDGQLAMPVSQTYDLPISGGSVP